MQLTQPATGGTVETTGELAAQAVPLPLPARIGAEHRIIGGEDRLVTTEPDRTACSRRARSPTGRKRRCGTMSRRNRMGRHGRCTLSAGSTTRQALKCVAERSSDISSHTIRYDSASKPYLRTGLWARSGPGEHRPDQDRRLTRRAEQRERLGQLLARHPRRDQPLPGRAVTSTSERMTPAEAEVSVVPYVGRPHGYPFLHRSEGDASTGQGATGPSFCHTIRSRGTVGRSVVCVEAVPTTGRDEHAHTRDRDHRG